MSTACPASFVDTEGDGVIRDIEVPLWVLSFVIKKKKNVGKGLEGCSRTSLLELGRKTTE